MNKIARAFFAAWVVFSGSVGSPAPCVADSTVTLKNDYETTRPTVRLSDLFSGVPSAIDRDVAQAPQACKPALYDETVLKKLAQIYRLDWTPEGAANHLTVTSPCIKITTDELRENIIERLKEDPRNRKASFEVLFDKASLEIALPTNDKPNVSLQNFSYDPASKRFRTDALADTPRGPFITPLTGRVIVKRDVPVLARRLERGTIIGPNDIDFIAFVEERISSDVITEPSQLIGRELRRDTPENEILRSRDIMPQRFVQRGNLVTMKIETPYIQITAQGKAQQDGTAGDTIKILNTQSNRIVEGIVVAPGVVEIPLSKKMASAE